MKFKTAKLITNSNYFIAILINLYNFANWINFQQIMHVFRVNYFNFKLSKINYYYQNRGERKQMVSPHQRWNAKKYIGVFRNEKETAIAYNFF